MDYEKYISEIIRTIQEAIQMCECEREIEDVGFILTDTFISLDGEVYDGGFIVEVAYINIPANHQLGEFIIDKGKATAIRIAEELDLKYEDLQAEQEKQLEIEAWQARQDWLRGRCDA